MNEGLEDLAGVFWGSLTLNTVKPLADIERAYIEAVLHLFDQDVQRAAYSLQIAPSTLYRKKAVWENEMLEGRD